MNSMVLMDILAFIKRQLDKIMQTIDWLFLIDPTIMKIDMRIGRKFHIYK